MFWGLIMEPERRYSQQVKKSFHISMAALDVSSSGEEPAQVMCGYEGRNYLLCTLKKPDMIQCHLDLEFSAGTQVSFASNGKSHIHLTGYLTDVDENGLSLEDLEEQEDEEVEEEQVEEKPKKKRKIKKEKVENEYLEEQEDEEPEEEQLEEKPKNKKLKKIKAENEPPSKKAKLNGTTQSDSDEDSDALFDEQDEDSENEDEEDSDEDGEEEEEESNAVEEEVVQPKPSKKQVKQQQVQKAQQKINGDPKMGQQKNQKKVLGKGVLIEDLVEGNGPVAKAGRFATVYYEGKLEKNNKVFDSTKKGPGFKFRLGAGEVIKGWDIGVAGMKVGGKRKIVCPPHTAYGAKGSPPAIPPNSTLVFTVELKKLN